jgi:hypothetical protein
MAEEHQEYPRMLYHHRYAPEGKVFQSAEETQALERKGWVDTPAKFPAKSKLRLNFERIAQFLRSTGWQTVTAWKCGISTIYRYGFHILMTLGVAGSFLLLKGLNKLDLFPATLFSVVAICFSYHAYRFSKEKFRLDLFEKRFEIYQNILEFCSIIATYGNLPIGDHNKEERIRFQQAADASFRSTGFHKTRSLFGEDIYEICLKLNKSYAFFLTYSDRSIRNPEAYTKEWLENMTFMQNTIDRLPIIFEAYISFGEYKK